MRGRKPVDSELIKALELVVGCWSNTNDGRPTMDDGDGGWLFVIGDWLLVNDITTTDGTAKNEERETRRPGDKDTDVRGQRSATAGGQR
jgi:hypothetical protein